MGKIRNDRWNRTNVREKEKNENKKEGWTQNRVKNEEEEKTTVEKEILR